MSENPKNFKFEKSGSLKLFENNNDIIQKIIIWCLTWPDWFLLTDTGFLTIIYNN